MEWMVDGVMMGVMKWWRKGEEVGNEVIKSGWWNDGERVVLRW